MTSYRRTSAKVVGHSFQPSVARLVSADRMRVLGLEPSKLEPFTVELVRLTASGKWHVADTGEYYRSGCQHLDRLRYNTSSRARATIEKVPVLGDYDLCTSCAERFGLEGPAGVYFRAARLIDQTQTWVEQLEKGAGQFDWLAYSRWTARTPFGEPDRLAELLAGLKGASGWTRPREGARAAWAGLRERAEAAWQVARQAAGPPGYRARAATVRDSLSRDRRIIAEANGLNGVAGYALYGGYCPDPWASGSLAWVCAVATDGDLAAGRRALTATVERLYHDLPARDLKFLPQPAALSGAGFCCPAHWADAEFHAMRHAVAERWSDRLELELHEDADTAHDSERLLLVVGWPLVSEDAREIAYVVQYPVLALGPETNLAREGRGCGQAAVLRVPAAAARHAAAASTHYGEFRFELDDGAAADDAAALALLRRASAFVAEESDLDPDPYVPAQATVEARSRASRYRSPEFEQWRADPEASVFGLGYHWVWTPENEVDLEAEQFDVLDRLMLGHHEMTYTVMAGPYRDLQQASFTGYLSRADREGHQLLYRVGHTNDAPVYRLPIRRLVSMSPAR